MKIACSLCGSQDNLEIYNKIDEATGEEYKDGYCWSPDCGFKSKEWLKANVDLDNVVIPVRKSGRRELSEEDITKIQEVLEKPFVGWKRRKLSRTTSEFFGVRTQLDSDNIIKHRYYPSTLDGKLVGFHARNEHVKRQNNLAKESGTPKSKLQPFWPVGICNMDCDLFGQSLFPKGKKFLIIVGGEEDAMVMYQVMKSKSPKYETACVSPTVGEGNAFKQIQNNFDFVSSFETVIIMMDNDDTGKKAAKGIAKLLRPGQAKIANFTKYNDPSEYMERLSLEKATDLLYSVFWDSIEHKPSQVLTVDDIFERSMTLPEMGLSFPWHTATEKTLGIRRAEVHIVGAAPKIGKTEHQHQMIKHMTEVHGIPVGVMSLEENPVKTLKKVAGKYAGKQFTKPPEVGGYTLEEMRIAFEGLRGKIEFYSSEGVRDADEILKTVRYWASQGIWFFIIDPLTALVAEHSSGDANDILNNFMSKIASMAMELQITFFIYSHVNPVKNGKPHDQGGDVLSSQFTGSRAMEKWAHYGWGIQRDRTEKNSRLRNTARVTMLFDREFGEYCEYYAFYNNQTNDWSECSNPEYGTDDEFDPELFDEVPPIDDFDKEPVIVIQMEDKEIPPFDPDEPLY